MELISRPILTDPSRFGTEVAGPIEHGEGANLIVSPYDVPDTISVFRDRTSKNIGIRLTYIVDEPTEKRFLTELLHAEIGRKSSRIYSLVAKYPEESNIRLSQVILDGFSTLKKVSSARRRTNARGSQSGINMNFRLVKCLLQSNASRIDNLSEELMANPT